MMVSTSIFKRLAKYFACAVLLVLLLLIWIFSTESGTRTLFTQVLPNFGVKTDNIKGSLLKGIQFDDLHIQTTATDVHLYGSRVDILWGQLFFGKVHVQDLSVNHLKVNLSGVNEPEPEPELTGNPQIPTLPIGIVVDNLQLNQFTLIQANGQRLPLDFAVKAKLQEQQQNTLELDVDLKEFDLSNVLPHSYLAGAVHITADAQSLQQWENLALTLQTDEKSVWNAKPLQANGNVVLNLKDMFVKTGDVTDIYLEKLKLAPSDLVLAVGKNIVHLQGQLGAANDVLQLKAVLPELVSLYPNIGQSAQLDLQLQGSLEQHHLVTQASYVQKAVSTDASTSTRQSTVGQGPIQLALTMQGKVSHILQKPQWQAQLQQLQVQHASYELSNQTPVQVDVHTQDTLQWSVGEAILHLKQPSGNVTEIKHQQSSQQADKLLSQGNIEGFLIEKSVYRFHWLLEKVPQLMLSLNMQREQQEDIGVQKAPLANIKNLRFMLQPETEQNQSTDQATGIPKTSANLVATAITEESQKYTVDIVGDGEQTTIYGDVSLDLAKTIPLEQGVFDIQLSDGGGLQGHVKVDQEQQWQVLDANLKIRKVALERWSLGFAPQAFLNADIISKVQLGQNQSLQGALLKAKFLEQSQWNHQALLGTLDWSIIPLATSTDNAGNLNLSVAEKSAVAQPLSLLETYRLERAQTDLHIGSNHIVTQGALGNATDVLKLDVNLPAFAELYQGLIGGASLKGELRGGVAKHEVQLQAGFAQKGVLHAKNSQFVQAQLDVQGAWQQDQGWQGQLSGLKAQYQVYKLEQEQQALKIKVNPHTSDGKLAWEVGPTVINATIPKKQVVKIQSLGAKGVEEQWQTKGAIHHFVINKVLLDELAKLMGEEQITGGVVVRNQNKKTVPDLVLNLDWDVSFDKALKGVVNIVRESGDIEVPLQKKFDLGLKQLALKLGFTPTTVDGSLLKAELLLDTEQKGNAKLNAQIDFKGLTPVLDRGVHVNAIGGMKDIAWLSMFTDDLLSLGGTVDFDVKIEAKADGKWRSSGFVKGDALKIVEVENGVRLLDGTLRASFNNTKAYIEQLYFPAVIRVAPTEWRTRQWIAENPPAKHGSLSITGEWDLDKAKGLIRTMLDHYPVVQRSDRFAMMSGEVLLEATMPKIKLSGKVTADAGWASIDIKDTVPTVDGDVIILKPGQTVLNASSGGGVEDLMMNLTVDLGPRFYLVGMGLNSGLVGSITLVQDQGRLTAEGQFITRGGAIEAYGQRLQIARGEIAFSGNITNPSLNIEALRRGLEVEAGLRVIGTAKRPKITLVSYPEVSEVEKLSWLIMGRGPDSSGADLALLFSVGSSLIGGEEPFYRRVGIDEIGVRAGSVGEADNILPKSTVADSTAYRGYEQTNQLFYATKKFGDNWRVSAEQALSGSGSVLRGSYRLMKHLTVDLKAGTINGIELLYKRVFKD